MEELEKGLSHGVIGEQAQRIVDRALNQISQWGLVMPDVEPIVFDFGLGEFQTTGEVEFWIANEVQAGYCGKFLFLFAHQTCPRHLHREKVETFFVVRGRIRMNLESKELFLAAGDVLRVDTGQYHEFTGLEPSLLLEVSRPSIIDDNYFANPSIPIGGNYRGP